MNKKNFFIVACLTLISLAIRLYRLGHVPPLDVDEYSVAYNAFSLIKTGMDEWGVVHPLFFRAFGDYKLPIDIYSSAFLFKIFSPTVFWLRMPSAIFGALYTPLIYFLLKLFIKNKKLIMLGTTLAVISPLNMSFSHIISGSISQSFFTLFSLVLFAYYLKYKKNTYLIFSVILLSISLYTYPSSWIIGPGIFMVYVIILFSQKQYKIMTLLLIFVLALIPIIMQFYLGGSNIRLSHTSLMSQSSGSITEINRFRQHAQNDIPSKIIHNKVTYYLYDFIRNYAKHFDPQFLILSPKTLTFQRHLYAPLYLILLPFYYIGIITVFKKYNNPLFFLLLCWILISPIPSALTEGAVSSKRYLSFLGSELIFSMIGLSAVRIYAHSKTLLLILLLISLQGVHFFYFLYKEYPTQAVEFTHFKGNLLADVVKKQYSSVDMIVYTTTELGEPQIYPLFGMQYPPNKYIEQKKFDYYSWYYIHPFDKFYYSEDLNKIESFIKLNSGSKIILGLFSNYELSLTKDVCYNTIKQYERVVDGDSHTQFKEIIFKPCPKK